MAWSGRICCANSWRSAPGGRSSSLRISVVANVYRPGVEAALESLERWGKAGSHRVAYETSLSDYARPGSAMVPAEDLAQADMVLALGGDGTMLRAARLL